MIRRSLMICVLGLAICTGCQRGLRKSTGGDLTIVADNRLENPVKILADVYGQISGVKTKLELLSTARIESLAKTGDSMTDVIVSMPEKKGAKSNVASLPGAKQIAWTHPKGNPVSIVPVSTHPKAEGFIEYAGGPEGHRKWAEADFRVAHGKNAAEAYDWIVQNRTKKTYPMTAIRMLGELGGIRDGICIDIGCGSGLLDVEIAKRSNFKIIGLDIDPNVKPLFDKYIREANMQDRLSIVIGDAQKMPFPDNYADVIVSRGTLTFIPDIGKCLREVQRVMKPTGVAFLGGRYLYTPQKYKITNEKLRKIVAECGVPNAKVVDFRGQWVKIIGPKAPKASAKAGHGPHMLVGKTVAAYGIVKGNCLLVGRGDGGLEQALQKGTMEFVPDMKVTCLYANDAEVQKARKRLEAAKQSDRFKLLSGKLEKLPFEANSFDLIIGAGPMLLFSKRPKAMAELYRVLKPGGVSYIGGKFYGMPKHRRVAKDVLLKDAEKGGVKTIRVDETDGQWVEIRK